MTTDDLDTRRAKLTARLIHKLANAYDRALQEKTKTQHNIPRSQKALLIQLELGGSRVSELAHRMGVSKQAVSRLGKELEEKGLVIRCDDETDGRANKLVFTERGRKLVITTVDRLEAIEKEVAQELGTANAIKLNQLLTLWFEHLDATTFQ